MGGGYVTGRNGKPKPDKSLRDTENIPLTENVDDYMAREVLPYAPDAWIEPRKNKSTKARELGTVGYEIPFARYFYTSVAPRPVDDILSELHALEGRIEYMMRSLNLD